MTLKLIGDHAVDVGGGLVVEPGGTVPKAADKEIVERLQAEGLLHDTADSSSRDTDDDKGKK